MPDNIERTYNPYISKEFKLSDEKDLIGNVRFILNKLTPQNLQKLSIDLINLPITNEERLKNIVDLIFEYLEDQIYIQTYANLCKLLNEFKVSNGEEQKSRFIDVLLCKCRDEFYSNIFGQLNYNKNGKDKSFYLTDERIFKCKRKTLGNVIFLAELFKLNILTELEIFECLDILLNHQNILNLELFCRLLDSVGKYIDKPNNFPKINSYFDTLSMISKRENCLSSRTRFMILDLFDLRLNNWVPRRKPEIPQIIHESRRKIED